MKSCSSVASPLVRRAARYGGWFLGLALLSACGQKGPLTLPVKPATAAASPTPPAHAASAAPMR